LVADAWSRLLSLQLLPGSNLGVSNTLSHIAGLANFISQDTPYPIITAQNVDITGTSCVPPTNASAWEFALFEFGTWDPNIAAFTPTTFLGSSLSAGLPISSNSCITNYDNLGFVLGTSSSLFKRPRNRRCRCTNTSPLNSLHNKFNQNSRLTRPLFSENVLALLTECPNIEFTSAADLFATWPNPLFNLSSAPLVSAMESLSMVDGGESGQINPIFPMLLPERNVSVILMNDNDADTAALYPNGTELRNSFDAAQLAGLTRMPFIPEASVLVARNLTFAPVFFGFNDSTTAIIVWIPNSPATVAGGAMETAQTQINETQTDSMIANGVAVMSQNDSAEWATCMGCTIMEETGSSLPVECTACFAQYCFTQ
jgi:lysophospholipase